MTIRQSKHEWSSKLSVADAAKLKNRIARKIETREPLDSDEMRFMTTRTLRAGLANGSIPMFRPPARPPGQCPYATRDCCGKPYICIASGGGVCTRDPRNSTDCELRKNYKPTPTTYQTAATISATIDRSSSA